MWILNLNRNPAAINIMPAWMAKEFFLMDEATESTKGKKNNDLPQLCETLPKNQCSSLYQVFLHACSLTVAICYDRLFYLTRPQRISHLSIGIHTITY